MYRLLLLYARNYVLQFQRFDKMLSFNDDNTLAANDQSWIIITKILNIFLYLLILTI